jgi:peptide/nickel transport system permease protein
MADRTLGRTWFLLVSILFLTCIVGTAALAPLLSSYSPTQQDLDKRLAPPGTPGHMLGTDDFGRDILTRIMYGSRSVLVICMVAVSIALLLGTMIGLVSGLLGGFVDSFLMLIMDSVLSFPTVLLAIAVVTAFGYGLLQVMIALGVVFSPVFARIVRAETMALMAEGFVESARALGSPLRKIIVLHLVPNMMPKIIVQFSVSFALAILIEASLSFLGLGAQPPEPSWGLMLKDARNYLFQAPWLAVYPGLALAATIFSLNYFGDVLAEWLNPTL